MLVFFNIGELRWLYLVGRAIDRNYGGYGFRCELVTTDLPPHPVGFCLCTDTNDLRGPPLVGRPALEAAATLAARIDRLLSPELAHVRAHFGLTD